MLIITPEFIHIENIIYIDKGREQGMEKGILKGRVEGLEQGLEQGQAENQREIAFKMLRKGMSMDIIHELTELSEDDIRAFQKNGHENSRENAEE
ncbi:MAG: hypothetical protein ACR2PY_01460 [Salinispira sp.]